MAQRGSCRNEPVAVRILTRTCGVPRDAGESAIRMTPSTAPRGYSAGDLEGNLWSFGSQRQAADLG